MTREPYATGPYLVASEHDLPRFMYEVSYLAYDDQFHMHTHRHTGMELIVCLSGVTILETAHSHCLLPPGSVTLLQGHVPHRIRVLIPPYRRWLLHLDPERFGPPHSTEAEDALSMQFRADTHEQATMIFFFTQLMDELSGIHYSPWRSYRLVHDLLARVVRTGQERRRLDQGHDWHPWDAGRVVERTITAIHQREFNVTVKELAERVNLSPSHLRRVFRNLTTISIADYMRIQRLEYAGKLLLEDPKVSVSEIADRLGFWNIAYFSRYFKQHTGYSPTEYQQLQCSV